MKLLFYTQKPVQPEDERSKPWCWAGGEGAPAGRAGGLGVGGVVEGEGALTTQI